MKRLEEPVRKAEVMGRQLRRRIGVALFLRGFLSVLGPAAFAAGAVVLLLRVFAGSLSAAAPAGIAAAALVLSAVCGAGMAARHLPERRKLLVWLDSAGGSGGMLAAALEVDPGAWRGQLQLPPMPKIRVGCRRGVAVAAAGMIFLVGALLIPQSRIVSGNRHALDITEETAELEQKLEVLEEASLMREEELEDLRAGLEALEINNDARETARTYELLDALARKVELAGEAAGERVRNEVETLRMVSNALDSLSALPLDQVPPEAAAQMGALLEQLARENPELAEMLANAGRESSKLDPGTMKRLADAMRDSSGNLEKKLAKLVEQKLMNARCARPGQCDGRNGACASPGSCPYGEDLASWLEKNAPGADELQQAVLAVCAFGEEAGKGGISRGRGDALLRYIGNTKDSSATRRDFSVAGANDPAQSMVVQRFAAAPNVDESERRAAAAGHLRGGDVEMEQRDTPVYPEHRAAVERYFTPKGK